MSLKQIVYSSRPFGFTAGVLDDILTISRTRNARDNLTGTLICRGDMYLQLIEGPGDALDAAYARIAEDDRHCEVKLQLSRTITTRMFPGWAMRDDPPRSWMWTQDEVAAGALAAASAADMLRIFERLAGEASAG